jgi:hypothetical protein
MSLDTHAPETDLILPLPEPGETLDPHTIHTHYFGFSIPEARIGAFIYIRYQPAFPLSQGGVGIFRGTHNVNAIDMDHLDYEITMPWPQVDGNTITTTNGLRIEFLEPGRVARLTYENVAAETSFEVVQTAVTPLLARGHIVPGEEQHTGATSGGSEQFMHCQGELVLHGERFDVDCFAPRDRSWRQVRVEKHGAVPSPPIGWSPMYFGDDLVFNQISVEAPDTDPTWAGIYEFPEGRPTHHYAWIVEDGETYDIVRVRRNVLEQQPVTYATLRQEIEAEDERGKIHRFTGEALATATMPAWPNCSFHDSVFRWEDEQGRVAHATYQELWFDTYQRAVHARELGATQGS